MRVISFNDCVLFVCYSGRRAVDSLYYRTIPSSMLMATTGLWKSVNSVTTCEDHLYQRWNYLKRLVVFNNGFSFYSLWVVNSFQVIFLCL